MKKPIIALSAVLFLSACGDSNDNQNDPIENTPPQGPAGAAPADQDPTPQTGSGGQSPSTAPAGTVQQ